MSERLVYVPYILSSMCVFWIVDQKLARFVLMLQRKINMFYVINQQIFVHNYNFNENGSCFTT